MVCACFVDKLAVLATDKGSDADGVVVSGLVFGVLGIGWEESIREECRLCVFGLYTLRVAGIGVRVSIRVKR